MSDEEERTVGTGPHPPGPRSLRLAKFHHEPKLVHHTSVKVQRTLKVGDAEMDM
jgi:hypothetical protein